jgi:hypothetical protein
VCASLLFGKSSAPGRRLDRPILNARDNFPDVCEVAGKHADVG